MSIRYIDSLFLSHILPVEVPDNIIGNVPVNVFDNVIGKVLFKVPDEILGNVPDREKQNVPHQA